MDERSFYELESKNNNWSLRELERQFNSGIYERILLSKDPNSVKQLALKGKQ